MTGKFTLHVDDACPYFPLFNIYIFIHTKCSNKTKQNKICNNKDALSVSGALVARCWMSLIQSTKHVAYW